MMKSNNLSHMLENTPSSITPLLVLIFLGMAVIITIGTLRAIREPGSTVGMGGIETFEKEPETGRVLSRALAWLILTGLILSGIGYVYHLYTAGAQRSAELQDSLQQSITENYHADSAVVYIEDHGKIPGSGTVHIYPADIVVEGTTTVLETKVYYDTSGGFTVVLNSPEHEGILLPRADSAAEQYVEELTQNQSSDDQAALAETSAA